MISKILPTIYDDIKLLYPVFLVEALLTWKGKSCQGPTGAYFKTIGHIWCSQILTKYWDYNKIGKLLKHIVGEVIKSLLFRAPIVKKSYSTS